MMLGQYLKDLRKKKEMTLEEAAQAAGISLSYLWRIEEQDRRPSEEVLRAFASIYNCDYYGLYILANKKEPKLNLDEILQSKSVQVTFQGKVVTPKIKTKIVDLLKESCSDGEDGYAKTVR